MMTAPAAPPAHWAARPLFEPIAGLLARFPAGLPDADALTALLRETAPAACSGAGAAIRFVPPPADLAGYEAHIHTRGEVPTRPGDWHDFFNALAWCVWPRSKSACNALHLAALRAREAAGEVARGPVRDALTQLDECGLVVVSSDPEILALLAAHEWEKAFWQRRQLLTATTRFRLIGHASWDQLRAPFVGLCGKALYRQVDPAWLTRAEAWQQADSDAWLAARLLDPARPLGRNALRPLPLLGIPGVTPDSEAPDYYRDLRQFRPLRRGADQG